MLDGSVVRKKIKRMLWIAVSLLAVFLGIGIFFWAKYRIPTGDVLTSTATVQYQMIDVGQGEAGSRSIVELLSGNRRLFLHEGIAPFVYAESAEAQACWPESPFEMAKKGYTIQITFRIRKLRFADGYTPISKLQVQRVSGTPAISK
jgi:hypothetical protein